MCTTSAPSGRTGEIESKQNWLKDTWFLKNFKKLDLLFKWIQFCTFANKMSKILKNNSILRLSIRAMCDGGDIGKTGAAGGSVRAGGGRLNLIWLLFKVIFKILMFDLYLQSPLDRCIRQTGIC